MSRWCDDGMHWLEMGGGRLRFHPLQMGEMAHGRLAFSWPACTGCLPLSESIEISSLHQLAGLKRPRISIRCFPPGLAFSHSVALNDRSENLKSKATIDGLHTAARLLKTWSNARAAPTAARCVCTGVGHGTHLGTNNNKYESAMHRLDRDRAVAHACWSSD